MYANEKKIARATVPNCSLDMDGIGSSIGIFFFSLKHTLADQKGFPEYWRSDARNQKTEHHYYCPELRF